MKVRVKSLVSVLVLLICVFLLTNCQTFRNGNKNGDFYFSFYGNSDGSVFIDVHTKDYNVPTQDFELASKMELEEFKFNKTEGNWNNYTVSITNNTYTMFESGNPVYTSEFSYSSDNLVEKRVWYSANEYYGFGESSTSMNLAGQQFKIFNESKYGNQAFLFIPYYVTNESDGVYYEANGKDVITFQSDKKYGQRYSSSSGRIASFYWKSSSIKENVTTFYKMSNSYSLLPKWAYGFIQSKYGYKNQQEVVDLVNEFDKRNIPLSGVVLDLYWFEKMGDIYWNEKAFPDPKGLNDFMEEKGVKLITITEPFYTNKCINHDDFLEKDFFGKSESGNVVYWNAWWCLGDPKGAIINPLHPDASKILGEKYAKMLDSGIDGFWTDLGEPESAPSRVMFNNITENQFHNYFNYFWSKAIYDGVTQIYPDKRLFMLSRSAYTGSTQFNVSVWSGDVAVSFPSLQKQIVLGLTAGMSGLPYWGSDVGGFTPEKFDDELLVRWYQFGAFTPVFRAHGTGPREPWASTEENTKIISKYINYRMNILPYTYSLAWEANTKGIPMMRPLFFEQSNIDVKYLDSEYYYGPYILSAPITVSKRNAKTKEVYLPTGNWYDFETLKRFEGDKTYTFETSMENFPLFIKEDAIIPMQSNGKDILFVIPTEKSKSEFVWYEDDGETNNYKTKNEYVEIKCSLDGMKLNISGIDKEREITVVIPNSVSVKTSGWQKKDKVLYKTIKVSDNFNLDI